MHCNFSPRRENSQIKNLSIAEALNTKIPEIICMTMRAIQRLVRSGECIGESLVPYFRQILPIPNLLKDKNGKLIYIFSEKKKISKKHTRCILIRLF